MAKLRIFISSTYYDLKHLRSSLENFIDSLGYEAILSEKGDIAYVPDAPLDESCYREATTADIFVLIIGGRYGSEASTEEKKPTRSFFDRYESITKQEYRHASSRDIPTYILIESSVYAEYRTFLKNKTNEKIKYAHVDSVNIFHLIDHILTQPKNNPVFTFDRYSEIEKWLKEQWSGLFKELLGRMSGQQQIASLASKVTELGEINITLRRYLETVISTVSPDESKKIIKSEEKRLEEAQIFAALADNPWIKYLTSLGFSMPTNVAAIKKAESFKQFVDLIYKDSIKGIGLTHKGLILRTLLESKDAQCDYNEARKILGLAPLEQDSSK